MESEIPCWTTIVPEHKVNETQLVFLYGSGKGETKMSHRDLVFYLNPNGGERRSVMAALANHGIHWIGVDGFSWNPQTDEDAFTHFHRDLKEFGLEVWSMHAVPPLMVNADVDLPVEMMEALQKDLRRLAAGGGRTAVYHACWMRDVPPDNFDREIDRVGWEIFKERMAAVVSRLASEAAGLGITVVLENIWHTRYAAGMSTIKEIVQTIGERNVGLCLDSGHAHLAGKNVAEEVLEAGAFLKDMHFHDNVGSFDISHPDQHLPPGLGTINWQSVCRNLNRIEYPGPVVFEGILGPGDSIANGRFGGGLSHSDLVGLTIQNWRAYEYLALQP